MPLNRNSVYNLFSVFNLLIFKIVSCNRKKHNMQKSYIKTLSLTRKL